MIKNLKAALPELGKIKSGVKGKEITSKEGNKFRPPQKLDHFIITTMERDTEGDFIQDTAIMELLKKSPNAKTDKNGNLTGIPIRLLYNDIQLNFPNRLACYVGGVCVCSGDGEAAQTRAGRNITCPCEKIDPTYKGKEKCKYNGKLYCVIDGTTSIGACHVLRTTSFNTIQSILGGLSFIQAAAGGMLAFLPLQLVLTPKTTVIPDGAPVTVYIASIVYNGSIDKLRTKALGMAQDRAKYLIEIDNIEASAKQLMASVVESEEEAKDIQEEFYPDAVEVKAEPKIEPKAEPKVESKPESKPEKKQKPKPEPKKESEPKPEPAPEPAKTKVIETTPENMQSAGSSTSKTCQGPTPITDDQKRTILKLKKSIGITDNKKWKMMVQKIVPDIGSAVDMTTEEADKFIKYLESCGGDIPFQVCIPKN